MRQVVNPRYVTIALWQSLCYVTPMAMTTAERQAQYRKRKQQQLENCITPDEVRRAVRLMFDFVEEQYPPQERQGWDRWLSSCQTKAGRGQWFDMLPMENVRDQWIEDGFSPEDAALLSKVAAVRNAMVQPQKG